MSERGSFVTEYIYCFKCFVAVSKILCQEGKDWDGSVLFPSGGVNTGGLPYMVIAGKCGATSPGGEKLLFEEEIIPEIEKVICHPIRIAVLHETIDASG